MNHELRLAELSDVDGARSVMLDTFYHEFGIGYVPQWHFDVIDPVTHYLNEPRHALFVASCDGQVVATTAVRAAAPNHPPHPKWLVERYTPERTAQLFRVYVRPEHRRYGLATRLVALAREFVAATPGYDVIYLHTDTRTEGTEKFWGSLAEVVHDARDGDPTHAQIVHFEMPGGVVRTGGPARRRPAPRG